MSSIISKTKKFMLEFCFFYFLFKNKVTKKISVRVQLIIFKELKN